MRLQKRRPEAPSPKTNLTARKRTRRSAGYLSKEAYVTSNPKQRAAREPLYDTNPQTGAIFEVFYSDRTLETFGRGGAGWFWWSRRRGSAPEGPATGPFATSYAAYRNAFLGATLGAAESKLKNCDTDQIDSALSWRREWDSNPRYGIPSALRPSRPIQDVFACQLGAISKKVDPNAGFSN
jgi:hypothetical protein